MVLCGARIGTEISAPTIALFRTITERHHVRARRRFLRARCLTPLEDSWEVCDDDAYLVEPSEDESIPAQSSDVPLTLPSYLSLHLAGLDPRVTVPSLKSSGDTLESGPTNERSTEKGIPRNGEIVDVTNDQPRKVVSITK